LEFLHLSPFSKGIEALRKLRRVFCGRGSSSVPHPLWSPLPRETRCLMPISQDLLEILVCPLCKEPVTLTSNNQGLKCSKCKRVYPIKDDIPVMLIDEAKVEE